MAFNAADIFPGVTALLKNASDPVPISELSSADVIGLYFSARGPGRGFTPVLSKIYTKLKTAGKAFEIVFVSADRDEKSMKSYFADMPWLSLQWADKKNLKEDLDKKYECEGTPHLVLINAKTGDIITLEGIRIAREAGADAFPFTREAVDAAIKKKTSLVLSHLDSWSALGTDTASLQAHEAIAIFIGNPSNYAKYVVGPLIEASNTLGSRLKVFYLPTCDMDPDVTPESPSGPEDHFFDYISEFPSSWTVDRGQLRNAIFICETLDKDIDEPLLLIVDPSCTEVIQTDACRIVAGLKDKAFPWSNAAVERLQAEMALKLKQLESKISEPGLRFLDDAKIVTHPSGASHTLQDLRELDLVAVYFSAHWCPPCRGFTPQLAQTYTDITAAGKKFGVVFVSGDRDEKAFEEYFHEMPWVALDYAQRELEELLEAAFNVEGIPTLVLIDPKTGKFTTKGRKQVEEGAAAFPWAL